MKWMLATSMRVLEMKMKIQQKNPFERLKKVDMHHDKLQYFFSGNILIFSSSLIVNLY